MKFLQRLFIFLFLFALAAVGFGYYQGLGLDDAEQLITDLIDRVNPPSDSTDTAVIPEPKPAPTPGSTPTPERFLEKKEAAPIELQPLPPNPFARIDSLAQKTPEAAEQDIKALAGYLSLNAQTDLEKARAIYIWLTENVSYDAEAYNSGEYGASDAEGVLTSRKAVCGGFSTLYLALGEEMGLNIKKVLGYAKGYGYSAGMKLTKPNHAWNIINIDGQWRMFDATWGEGYGTNVNGKLVTTKAFNNYWFNVDPYEGIFNHLPENSTYSHVTPGIGLKTYEALPDINEAYFALGFDAKTTYENVLARGTVLLPTCYDVETHVEMIRAPKYELLMLGRSYDFEFYIPRGMSVSIIDATNNWTYFEGQKGVFKLNYAPTVEGELSVNVKYDNGETSYTTLMVYAVKSGKAIS